MFKSSAIFSPSVEIDIIVFWILLLTYSEHYYSGQLGQTKLGNILEVRGSGLHVNCFLADINSDSK